MPFNAFFNKGRNFVIHVVNGAMDKINRPPRTNSSRGLTPQQVNDQGCLKERGSHTVHRIREEIIKTRNVLKGFSPAERKKKTLLPPSD